MFLFSYYVGLDVHRKSISFCVKRADGAIVREGKITSTREAIASWLPIANISRPFVWLPLERRVFSGMADLSSEHDFFLPVKRRRALVATNLPRNNRPDSSGEHRSNIRLGW